MPPYDVAALTTSMPTLDLARRPTREEAMASMVDLGALNECKLFVARFSGSPPWERHPDDELIYVLDGHVEIRVLTEPEETRVSLSAGSLYVVPRNTWHRSNASDRVTVLGATPAEGSTNSLAADPREES